MRNLLIDFKFLKIDYFDLILSIIIIGISVFLNFYISKKQKNAKSKTPRIVLIVFLWVFALILISLLTIPKFSNLVIFENKHLIITPIGIVLITVLIFINLFLINYFTKWIQSLTTDKQTKSYNLYKLVFILISIYLVLKILLKNSNKIIDFVLFEIKNITITISNIFFLIIALFSTAFIILLIKIGLKKLTKANKLATSTSTTLLIIIKYFVWTIAIIFSLQFIGFNLSILLAGSAALLVGIGMGIQQLFNDFASGLILLFERKIRVNDFIETEAVTGRVIEIGFRTTLVLTRDNVRIIIPNSKLVSNNVINWTNGEKYARIGINVGVAYGSDTHKVKEILSNCAKKHKKVLKKPKPEVLFKNFGNSSLDFTLYVYTESNFFRETIKSDLRFSIYDDFNKYNVQIPFPQMDLHFPDKDGFK